MGDCNDEDVITPHHVERCAGKLFENDSARAMFPHWVPLWRYADPLNDSSQCLQESSSGQDATFLTPGLRASHLGRRRRMEPNAHSDGTIGCATVTRDRCGSS
jgi:hypothetical protein